MSGICAPSGATGTPAARRSLGVFCGARAGTDARWAVVAREFGARAAQRGWRLVFGGGHVGLMGAVADGALAAGGEVVGVIPRSLMARELAHRTLSVLEVVDDMATRKTRMIDLSDAFAALPGGFGTLDELFEVLTLRQIGEHRKPVGLLDQQGFWQPLLTACDAMVATGFVHPDHRAMIITRDAVDALLDALDAAVETGADPRQARTGR
jgi:uncharacterized protein (TIGR00730 family)